LKATPELQSERSRFPRRKILVEFVAHMDDWFVNIDSQYDSVRCPPIFLQLLSLLSDIFSGFQLLLQAPQHWSTFINFPRLRRASQISINERLSCCLGQWHRFTVLMDFLMQLVSLYLRHFWRNAFVLENIEICIRSSAEISRLSAIVDQIHKSMLISVAMSWIRRFHWVIKNGGEHCLKWKQKIANS
jgi:hypothetical protein